MTVPGAGGSAPAAGAFPLLAENLGMARASAQADARACVGGIACPRNDRKGAMGGSEGTGVSVRPVVESGRRSPTDDAKG